MHAQGIQQNPAVLTRLLFVCSCDEEKTFFCLHDIKGIRLLQEADTDQVTYCKHI